MSEPKRLRIILDGQEINETPDGWQDIVSSIKRVKELNALFITTEAELTFQDDGYTYLMTRYDDGFCNSVAVELQEYCGGVYEVFFIGIIFISSAKVDRKNCTIKVSIEDNSFYAKINNNKGLDVFPFAEQTRNASLYPTNPQYILAPCVYERVQMFNPVDGVYVGVPLAKPYTAACYPVFNLFEYLIKFMTDNTVGFASNLFSNGGDFYGLVVTCGFVLRQYDSGTGTDEADFKSMFQKISFEQLFTEVSKKVNIGMIVDYSGSQPVIRIERVSDLRTNATIFRALNINDLTESIDFNALFASVRIGSSTVSEKLSPAVSFPGDISGVGFKEEQLIVLGKCNIDKELNLVSDFIIDTNIIQDCFVNGEDQFDDNLFFIMCDTAGANFVARQGNLEGQAGLFPVFYNLDLNGISVLDNYLGAVPLSVAQYLGNADNTFLAGKTAYTQFAQDGINHPVIFNDETTPPFYDTNNNYNQVTGEYTIPKSGLYTFEAKIDIFFQTTLIALSWDIDIYMEHYDSLMSPIEIRKVATHTYNYGFSSATFSSSFSTVNTDIIRVAINIPNLGYFVGGFFVAPSSTFACTNAVDGGGIYKSFDPNDYPVYQHQWEYPLTINDFKAIAQNQTGQIEFARYGERNFSGWIDSVKFKRFSTEMAKFITYRAKTIPIPSNVPPEIRFVVMTGKLPDIPYTISPDYYGNPFSGSSTTVKTHFYLVGSILNISIPPVYLGANVYAPANIYITKFFAGGSTATAFTVPNARIVIEKGCNYWIECIYDLAGVGNTYPSILPMTIAPVTAGANGTAFFYLFNPANVSDYTFLWSTGATTSSIVAPAGNYTCVVTNINPGTFDHNSSTFKIQIPISETGQ